jgi:hypothetical protein
MRVSDDLVYKLVDRVYRRLHGVEDLLELKLTWIDLLPSRDVLAAGGSEGETGRGRMAESRGVRFGWAGGSSGFEWAAGSFVGRRA